MKASSTSGGIPNLCEVIRVSDDLDSDLVFMYLSQFIFDGRDIFTAEELVEFLRSKGVARIEVNRTIKDWLFSMEELGLLRQIAPGTYSLK